MASISTFLQPPYTKIHILAAASITLLMYMLVLYALIFPFQPNRIAVTNVEAADVAKDFKQPLGQIQHSHTAQAWRQSGFIVYDIRSTREFEQKHITGAINAPVSTIGASSLAKATKVIIYSDNQTDLEAAAGLLADQGFTAIYQLHATIDELTTTGYTMSEGELGL